VGKANDVRQAVSNNERLDNDAPPPNKAPPALIRGGAIIDLQQR